MENTKITFKLDIMLFIIFLILKLDGIIQWKWVWVFAPIWAVWAIQGLISIVAAVANAIKNFEWKHSIARPVVSGPSLVWDAKTSTLYSPWSAGDNKEEKE